MAPRDKPVERGTFVTATRSIAAAENNSISVPANEHADFKDRTEKLRTAYFEAKGPEAKADVIRKAFIDGDDVKDHPYLGKKVFRDFANTLVADALKDDFEASRAAIDKSLRNGGTVYMGVFHVPYSLTELKNGPSFEAIMFAEGDPGPTFRRDYMPEKNILLISDTPWSTRGFTPLEHHVINFQDYWHAKRKNAPEILALYYIDRFVVRTKKYTLPILEHCINPNSFSVLRKLQDSKSDLIKAGFKWLGGHDNHHSHGPLAQLFNEANLATLDQNQLVLKNAEYGFDLKRFRETAAFEEMRVDLNMIIDLYSDRNRGILDIQKLDLHES